MGLNANIASSFLKGLVSQGQNIPQWLATTQATLGLSVDPPQVASGNVYYTYELSKESGTACDIPQPGGTSRHSLLYAHGYDREVIGVQSAPTYDKMSEPTDSSGTWVTYNKDILVLGENLGPGTWPTVNSFVLYKTKYEDDQEATSTTSRTSEGVLVFGLLKDAQGAATTVDVAYQTVPLFRIHNFELSFTAS